MRTLLFLSLLLIGTRIYAQERYIGWSRDSIKSFHAKNFAEVASNDTAVLVKIARDGTDWRFFVFDKSGICIRAAEEINYYNAFTDLEKKLKAKKYKRAGEVEYDFIVAKVKGELYTNGKENYVLMYKPINPNLVATVRSVVYYKTK